MKKNLQLEYQQDLDRYLKTQVEEAKGLKKWSKRFGKGNSIIKKNKIILFGKNLKFSWLKILNTRLACQVQSRVLAKYWVDVIILFIFNEFRHIILVL